MVKKAFIRRRAKAVLTTADSTRQSTFDVKGRLALAVLVLLALASEPIEIKSFISSYWNVDWAKNSASKCTTNSTTAYQAAKCRNETSASSHAIGGTRGATNATASKKYYQQDQHLERSTESPTASPSAASTYGIGGAAGATVANASKEYYQQDQYLEQSTASPTAYPPRNITLNDKHLVEKSTESPAASPTASPPRNITLIVGTAGELCNVMGYITQAYCIKFELEEYMPHIHVNIVGEHQKAGKWVRGAHEIPQCFPFFKDFEFEGGIWDKDHTGEYNARRVAMDVWTAEQQMPENAWSLIEIGNKHNLTQSFDFLQHLLDQQERDKHLLSIQEPSNATISLPFLRSKGMLNSGPLVAKWHHHLLEMFRLNETACCNHLAEPDEIVFHWRNFKKEGPRLPRMGFVEVDSSHSGVFVQDQIKRLNIPTNKVAIITRFQDQESYEPHVKAMEAANLTVRIVPPNQGVEDYCLLAKATYTMGIQLSTFMTMSSLMGNQTSVLLYLIDITNTRAHCGECFETWNMSPEDPSQFIWGDNPTLQKRMNYVLLNATMGNL